MTAENENGNIISKTNLWGENVLISAFHQSQKPNDCTRHFHPREDIAKCIHPAMKYLMIASFSRIHRLQRLTKKEKERKKIMLNRTMLPNFLLHSLLKPSDHNKLIFLPSFFLRFRLNAENKILSLSLCSFAYQSELSRKTHCFAIAPDESRRRNNNNQFIEIPQIKSAFYTREFHLHSQIAINSVSDNCRFRRLLYLGAVTMIREVHFFYHNRFAFSLDFLFQSNQLFNMELT